LYVANHTACGRLAILDAISGSRESPLLAATHWFTCDRGSLKNTVVAADADRDADGDLDLDGDLDALP
jgi:hypothetical protein